MNAQADTKPKALAQLMEAAGQLGLVTAQRYLTNDTTEDPHKIKQDLLIALRAIIVVDKQKERQHQKLLDAATKVLRCSVHNHQKVHGICIMDCSACALEALRNVIDEENKCKPSSSAQTEATLEHQSLMHSTTTE